MKTKVIFCVWVTCLGALLWLLFDPGHVDSWERKPIYDESADGSKQIADALVIAKQENKRVLLQFGANWCVWCHRLHRFFETDKVVKKKLQSDFVVVLVDVNNGHNAKLVNEYGEVARSGIPAVSILDSAGKLIASTSSADFAEDGNYSSTKILAFLNDRIRK